MIGTQFILTNQNGDTITINDHSDPTNLIALQDYPSFDLELKNQEIAKEGQHGIWDFYTFYGKRLITFSGIILGDTEAKVMEIQDQLKIVCGLPLDPIAGNDGLITIKYTDPRGRALQTTGKLFNSIRFSRVMKETFKLAFQLVLKSADPSIESQSETTSNGIRGYVAGSIKLPTKMSTKMLIVERQTLDVVNLGNTYANPTITIHGPLTNPRLENLNTAKHMQFTKTLTAGQYIKINASLGTIVDENGADISSSLTDGEFIKLKNGTNSLYLTSDENYGATNPLLTRITPTETYDVVHRDTYL